MVAELNVFDKRTGEHLVKHHDISVIEREPQGVSTYNGDLYINFQDAVWRIHLGKKMPEILR